MKRIKPAMSDRPVTRMSAIDDRSEHAVETLAHEFGTIEILPPEEARTHVRAFEAAVTRQYDDMKRLVNSAVALIARQRNNPQMQQRRFHIYVCRGCGDPILVTSGPRGHETKTTLSGGCFRCKEKRHGVRQGATMRYATWRFEIVTPELIEVPK